MNVFGDEYTKSPWGGLWGKLVSGLRKSCPIFVICAYISRTVAQSQNVNKHLIKMTKFTNKVVQSQVFPTLYSVTVSSTLL